MMVSDRWRHRDKYECQSDQMRACVLCTVPRVYVHTPSPERVCEWQHPGRNGDASSPDSRPVSLGEVADFGAGQGECKMSLDHAVAP